MSAAQTELQPARETYVYRINADDVIVWVGDNWQAFVDENRGAANTAAEAVLGKSLYDYICRLALRADLRDQRDPARPGSDLAHAPRGL